MLNSEKFGKNLSKYNSNAIIQKNIAKELIKLIGDKVGKNFNTILEIGCGSGFLTEEISNNIKYKYLILNDLTPDSFSYINKFSNNFICGDIEKIEMPNHLDLIISSSVFQWLNDFESFTLKVFDKLNTNGIFAFSMFINDNFKEIDEKLNISLNYLNNKKLLEILEKKFKIIMVDDKKKILRFNTSNEILRHIKDTGVNTINKTKLTKNKICDFINSNTLNLTYDYNFIIARKK